MLWPPEFAIVGSLGPYSGASSWLPARSAKSARLSRCRCCYHSNSIWQEGALLLVFLAIIAIALAVGVSVRPPKVLEILVGT